MTTVQHGPPRQTTWLAGGGMLSASGLPTPLSLTAAAQFAASCFSMCCDLKAGNTGLWVIDKGAEFGSPPSVQNAFVMGNRGGKWGVWSSDYYTFSIGRGPKIDDSFSSSHLTLPHNYVSGLHAILRVFPDLIHVKNVSETNGVYVGGGWVRPGEDVRIRVDAPFLIGFGEPESMYEGSILLTSMDAMFYGALKAVGGCRDDNDPAHDVRLRREPWRNVTAGMRSRTAIGEKKLVAPQAADVGGVIVTPPQITDLDEMIQPVGDFAEEGLHVRTSIGDWIEEGRLDLHVKGRRSWDTRLLANVRDGGMLLPTHSSDLEGAVSILKSGEIDPQYSRRKKKAFFRYGLGHSYGQIVFVQRPGTDGIGELHDIWRTMDSTREEREELFRLTGGVDFNKNLPLREGGDDGGHAGRTCMHHGLGDRHFMEFHPQFESGKIVPVSNSYLVMVPEHLYDELIERIPRHMRDLIVRVSGTGKDEKEFLSGRDRIARRSRWNGGTFEPVMGYDVLFRYELVYFKIVETVLRFRHLALRRRLEEFAQAATAAELSHSDMVDRIAGLIPFIPESFHVLHYREQYPSHDGHSPLGHTFNTLIEAAYLAPTLAAEFESLHVEDAFIALMLHDLGKMHGDDPGDRDDHGEHSLEMARYHLKMMGFPEEGDDEPAARRKKILYLIEHAGLISWAKLKLEAGKRRALVYANVFDKTNASLPDLFLVNFADVSSIPGRSGRKMRVNKNYKKRVIDVRADMIRMFRELLAELAGKK